MGRSAAASLAGTTLPRDLLPSPDLMRHMKPQVALQPLQQRPPRLVHAPPHGTAGACRAHTAQLVESLTEWRKFHAVRERGCWHHPVAWERGDAAARALVRLEVGCFDAIHVCSQTKTVDGPTASHWDTSTAAAVSASGRLGCLLPLILTQPFKRPLHSCGLQQHQWQQPP